MGSKPIKPITKRRRTGLSMWSSNLNAVVGSRECRASGFYYTWMKRHAFKPRRGWLLYHKTDITSYECEVCSSYTTAPCSSSRLSLGTPELWLWCAGVSSQRTLVCVNWSVLPLVRPTRLRKKEKSRHYNGPRNLQDCVMSILTIKVHKKSDENGNSSARKK